MRLDGTRWTGRARRWSLLAAVSVATACAIAPLQPDLGAKAPRLEGFGESDIAVSTSSAEARRLFNAGVLQAYAFNEAEAVRQFKAALAADPRCAICAWGVAWQLGPNINAPRRGDLTQHRQYAAYALRHAEVATPRERALIEAMALRYGEAPARAADLIGDGSDAGDVCRGAPRDGDERRDPLDHAYARRMHALVLAHPEDPEILSLWSEAAMVATTPWYDPSTGRAAPVIAEVVDRLERAVARHPRHTGLLHYLVHAADAPANAARAVAAADRLGAVAPLSPHLVHMPAHIYVRVGRYDDAARVNDQAVAADVAIGKVQSDQGFPVSKDWRGHNLHFLWYAELMQGRGDAALAAARALVQRARGDHVFAEYVRSLPHLTLLRLERWQALADEPLGTGQRGMAELQGQHARGVAYLRLGRVAEARAALAAVDAAAARLTRAHTGHTFLDRSVREMATHAQARLRAEVALHDGRTDEALAQFAKSVSAAKRPDDAEPPLLAAGARLALAEVQLRTGRAADAEATFRTDLAAQPGSGWALHGLSRALAAQGRQTDALAMRERAGRAWARADVALTERR